MRREVFYFDSGAERLYGSLYAAAEPSLSVGLVACGSWGIEADRTDPLLRSMALAMAKSGGAALLFHYPGYGDSYGDLAAVDLEGMGAAAAGAFAEASRRCPRVVWILAGVLFGASVAVLAQRRLTIEALLLVQPALSPGAYFQQLSRRRSPAPAPTHAGDSMKVGSDSGMAYGYPVAERVMERAADADAEVRVALEEFGGEGTVICHQRPPLQEPVPERFERIEVAGSWRFGSHNQPQLAAATAEWLQHRAGANCP